jgi:hypothetical protein
MWCIISLFFKFGGITLFLVLALTNYALTNYEEWGGDESTYYIPQIKQKNEKNMMN